MNGLIVKLKGTTGLQYLLIVVCLALPQSASAQGITTGSDLQEVCRSADRFTECVIFLKTVHQTAKAIHRLSPDGQERPIGSCAPEQGIDTVPLVIALKLAWQDYAGLFPERMQNLAVEETLLAIEARWPCAR